MLRSLDDDKAVDVVSIPLAGKSNIADHMVIASGRSTRQVASMAQKLSERIKRDLGRNVRVEGLPVADWVLIDADDVIVHLFRPEVRSFYNLERMWAFEDSAAARPRMRPPEPALSCCLHISRAGKIGRWPEAELVERYLKRITWPTKAHRAARKRRQGAAARREQRHHPARREGRAARLGRLRAASSRPGATAAGARRAS